MTPSGQSDTATELQAHEVRHLHYLLRELGEVPGALAREREVCDPRTCGVCAAVKSYVDDREIEP